MIGLTIILRFDTDKFLFRDSNKQLVSFRKYRV